MRCRADSAHTFTCDVHIDSEPTPSTGASEAAPNPRAASAASARPPDPAVNLLVDRYLRVPVARAEAPYISVSSLSSCASELAAMVLAAFGGKSPILGFVAITKAGFDAGACLQSAYERARNAATIKNVSQYCESLGQVVTSVNGDTAHCEMKGGGK